MRKTVIALVLLVVACGTRPEPVVPSDGVRSAIAISYVGVPEMKLYAEPNDASAVVTSYGYTETISILSRKGGWVEVRTVDGSAWARASQLISAAEVESILKNPVPRFMTPPVSVPHARARGEIVFEAKVNTSGEIIDVRTTSNTTGISALATANAAALRQARFYPLLQKGQRLVFTYEHRVAY